MGVLINQRKFFMWLSGPLCRVPSDLETWEHGHPGGKLVFLPHELPRWAIPLMAFLPRCCCHMPQWTSHMFDFTAPSCFCFHNLLSIFFEGTISYQINSLPNWVNSKPIILNNYYSRDQWFTVDSSIHHGHDRGFDLALQLCQLSLKAWSTKWPDLSMLPPHPASRAKRNQHKKGRRLDSGDKSR
jgi:hypothetical protein